MAPRLAALFTLLLLGFAAQGTALSATRDPCEQVFKSWAQFPAFFEEVDRTWSARQAERYWPELKRGDLAPEEIRAVGAYFNHDYAPINQFLRTGDVENNPRWQSVYGKSKAQKIEDVKSYIPLIDRVIEKSRPVPGGVILFRTESHPLSRAVAVEGQVISNAGYTSTSIDAGMARKMARKIVEEMEPDEQKAIVIQAIKVPPGGLPAVYAPRLIEAFSMPGALSQEREVLLRRGLSFKVVKVEKLEYGAKELKDKGLPGAVPLYVQYVEAIAP